MKKILSVLLCTWLLLCAIPAVNAQETEAVYLRFGSYPQTEVASTEMLLNAEYDENGDTEIGGVRYRKTTDFHGNVRFFRWEPILWQKYGDIFIAVNAIDSQQYDEQGRQQMGSINGGIFVAEPTSWEESTIRHWLNGTFLESALSTEEQQHLSGEIFLLTYEEAQQIIDEGLTVVYLQKQATQYADTVGCYVRDYSGHSGNTEWFLQNVSPLVSSCIWTVRADGSLQTFMEVLANEEGKGIVPCIHVKDLDGMECWTEPMPASTVTLYYPGGRTCQFAQREVAQALEDGWCQTEETARRKSSQHMETRFEASWVASKYDWHAGSESVSIHLDNHNLSPLEMIEIIKPIVDTFYTGDTSDYISFKIYAPYSVPDAATLDEFKDKYADAVFGAVESILSNWGNVVSVDNRSCQTAHFGAESGYEMIFQIHINGNGEYDLQYSTYFETLNRLTEEAKAFSDRPLGQLWYLANFLEHESRYDNNLYNNEPLWIVRNGLGICGTYANFSMDYCRLLGIPCLNLTSDIANHGWNMVYVDGNWYHMDLTGNNAKSNSCNDYMLFVPDAGMDESYQAEDAYFLTTHEPSLVGYEFGTDNKDSLDTVTLKLVQSMMSVETLVNPFLDVCPMDYYYESVLWAVNEGITAGYGSAEIFNPDGICTRGQVVTFLWRAAGKPEPASMSNPFTDVVESDFFYKAVLWAVEEGITAGYGSADIFNPDGNCTRGQVATFLHRYFEEPAPASSANPFTDVAPEAFYYNAVLWAVEQEITNGYGNAYTFAPDQECTRGQIVTFLYRAMK